LEASIDSAPDALPVLVLQLFGGLRRAEAEEMTWEDISASSSRLKGTLPRHASDAQSDYTAVARVADTAAKSGQASGAKLCRQVEAHS